MRSQLTQGLAHLNHEMISMGSLIECAIEQAVAALFQKEMILAESAISFDGEIDRKEKEIETLCLRLLLQQQPLAGDLRAISSALKMITDMERIGDQACDIAEIVLRLPKNLSLQRARHIEKMSKISVKMVKKAIDAFVAQDHQLAHQVIEMDDQVDHLFLQVREELILIIRENREDAEPAIDLLMIAKYFERIGDHAVNLSEWVLFSLTGEHKNFSKEEQYGLHCSGRG